jgi:hypothetical protein
MRPTLKTARMPVLKLLSAVMVKATDDGSAAAMWPNRIGELAHEIEAALRAAHDDGATPSSPVPSNMVICYR